MSATVDSVDTFLNNGLAIAQFMFTHVIQDILPHVASDQHHLIVQLVHRHLVENVLCTVCTSLGDEVAMSLLLQTLFAKALRK